MQCNCAQVIVPSNLSISQLHDEHHAYMYYVSMQHATLHLAYARLLFAMRTLHVESIAIRTRYANAN